ncbi:hypothetical protein HHI36_021676, partial [Cryptolaemus montrouzieri]
MLSLFTSEVRFTVGKMSDEESRWETGIHLDIVKVAKIKKDVSACLRETGFEINSTHEELKKEKCNFCGCFPNQNRTRSQCDYQTTKIALLKMIQCDYQAAQKSNFQDHVNSVHHGRKDYKCNQCNYQTNLQGNLKVH